MPVAPSRCLTIAAGHAGDYARRVRPALDPQAQDLLEAMRAAGLPPLHLLSVEQARARMRAAFARPASRGPQLESVSELAVPTPSGGRALRLYRPRAGRLPVALFFHGGGWTVNDLDTHDALCRTIARRSGWALAALDYRRAPEHRHPAALQDAHDAYRWLAENAADLELDAGSCALLGESSGATMAASLALLLRDTGAPAPTLQILVYPLIDPPGRWPSHERYASGYTLDRDQIDWYFGHVLGGHARVDGSAFAFADGAGAALGDGAGVALADGAAGETGYLLPLSDRDLSGVAEALVVTAEFDPLRDEGVAYAEQLARCGVPVRHVHVGDQMHGFLLHSVLVAGAARRVEEIADALAEHRAGAPPR